ncbi:MAG: coiled coil domain-containing protein, partial [Proteobacteria bacterium]|nr:coiled coil domain-containing protein [Pseudomonadota bacterium]
MATREEFEAKLKEQINGWNADLDKLEADAEAKIKYEKQIKELRQKAEEAQQNLTKIHDAGDDVDDDAW